MWLELEEGCLGAVVGAAGVGCTLYEGVVAMGVAGAVELPLALGEVIETLDGTFRCPLKPLKKVPQSGHSNY